MLVWARERMGYSRSDAAKKLKRPEKDLAAWEDGKAVPSFAQLEKLAYTVYKRPLALFYLPETPEETEPRKAFRTLPDSELDELLADTRLHIRHAQALQISLAEINEGENPAERLILDDVSFTTASDVVAAARRVRDYLGVSLDDQAAWPDNEEAFKGWRSVLEESGISVFKDSFKQREISGFCLEDQVFPLIYVNNSTAFSRQSFTLFHELAHLLLHTSGITLLDTRYINHLRGSQRAVEIFCNQFAAEFLVPIEELRRQVGALPYSDALIQKLARRFRVSREVVLRRFLDEGKVTQVFYEKKAAEWIDEYKRRPQKRPGGDYYATRASYLGGSYLRQAFGCYRAGRCSIEQLAGHLNVKARNVSGLEAFAS